MGARPEWLMTRFKGVQNRTILKVLVTARSEMRGASAEELGLALWPEGPKPQFIDNVLVLISALNAQLSKMGWAIVGPKQTGNGFQLVPLDALSFDNLMY